MRCLWLLALAVLAACAPAVADPRPVVVVINAPAEWRVVALADELEALVRAEPASAAYRFAFSESVRFQEQRRDLYQSRAPLHAAFMARFYGADQAVLVSAPRYERSVEPVFGDIVCVTATVQVQVVLVDPETAAVEANYRSSVVTLTELMSRSAAEREEAQDTLRSEARRLALAELAPGLATDLALRLGR